jgi:hypothetical protein
MNVHATASAKHWSNDGDVVGDLDALEAELRAAMNEDALFDLASAPAST